jgi:hypothetical protein
MLKISPAVDALKDETMKEKKTNNFFSIGIKPWFRWFGSKCDFCTHKRNYTFGSVSKFLATKYPILDIWQQIK